MIESYKYKADGDQNESDRRAQLYPWVANLEGSSANGSVDDVDDDAPLPMKSKTLHNSLPASPIYGRKIASELDEKIASLSSMFPDKPIQYLKTVLQNADGDTDSAAEVILANLNPSDSEASTASSSTTTRRRRLVKKGAPSKLSSEVASSSDSTPISSPRSRPPIDLSSPPPTDSQPIRVTKFFNTCATQQLTDATGCTPDQAEVVVSFRPFDDYDDLVGKLSSVKKQKLQNLVEKYENVMEGYEAVDQLIEKCERVGDDVMNVLERWTKGKREVLVGGANGGAEGEAVEGGPAISLTEVDESVLSDDGTDVDEEADRDVIVLDDDGKRQFKCLKRQPAIVNPKLTLKGYQLVGISWLFMLFEKKLGGILADEMGLGKTAQVISFLGMLKVHRKPGPHIVIVPSSTLDNWLREFEKWCPNLTVETYYGSQKDRFARQDELMEGGFDVLVTTYNLATGASEDRKFLRRLRCRCLILDEGHMVKNMGSARYKYLMAFNPQFRLLLTGTPLQNNLMELLALLTFVMPNLFAPNEDTIQRIFNIKQTNTSPAGSADAGLLSRQRIQRAKKIMKPFVLRRKKKEVVKELPGKTVNIVRCAMTKGQRAVYHSIVAESKKTYMVAQAAAAAAAVSSAADEVDESPQKGKGKKGKGKAAKAKAVKGKAAAGDAACAPADGKKQAANVLMQLRKAADHPLLFRRHYKDDKLRVMSKDIMKEVEYFDANQQYIFEDMQVMSDFELHSLCEKHPRSLKRHRLTEKHWMDAGKVNKLQELLPQMRERGDRVLIFSQFVMVLDILEAVMKTLGMRYVRMDGRTSVENRQQLIDEYNDTDEITVFLLSTKAGGFGINLTSANVVIIYDLDFNPHNDAQAEDRAHRVGQTRDVTVLKLISDGTIEEHILRLAEAKLKLDAKIQEEGEEDVRGVEGKSDEGGGESANASDDEGIDRTVDKKQILDILREEWDKDGDNGVGSDTAGVSDADGGSDD
ncbi:hypothetical protein HK097_001756 [Rhizophlyctis rosea]|uniref:DNA helicase n=1 Tax=Rhizophlyctis rosea TaxID=64517 RepID=A0AAD5SFZ2_9FUNG|nr:hypothetical protein HK097_001756 [Rhizophlyctis rosea]